MTVKTVGVETHCQRPKSDCSEDVFLWLSVTIFSLVLALDLLSMINVFYSITVWFTYHTPHMAPWHGNIGLRQKALNSQQTRRDRVSTDGQSLSRIAIRGLACRRYVEFNTLCPRGESRWQEICQRFLVLGELYGIWPRGQQECGVCEIYLTDSVA